MPILNKKKNNLSFIEIINSLLIFYSPIFISAYLLKKSLIFFFISAVTFFLFFLVLLLINKIINDKEKFFFLIILWILNFSYFYGYETLKINKIILILLIFLFAFFISKFTRDFFLNKKLTIFLLLFCFFNIIFSQYNYLKEYSHHSKNKQNNINEIYSSYPNIYFFLMDGMYKFEFLNKENKTKLSNTKNFEKFIEFNSRQLNFGGTNQILGSIFSKNKTLDYKILLKNIDQSFFFESLIQLNYKMHFVKNRYFKCATSNNVKIVCLKRTNFLNIFLIDQSIDYFNTYSFILNYFYRFVSHIDLQPQTEIKLFINYFKNKKKIKDNNFYFIHNIGPHYPWRDKNCKIKIPIYSFKTTQKINYETSLDCAVENLSNAINLIQSQDKRSIILILSDHGQKNTKINEKRKTIISLIKYNNCNKIDKSNNQNNILFKILECLK